MQKSMWIVGLVAVLGLAACGDTLGEQALYGAAGGAGTSAILGGDVVTGAALGAGGTVLACQSGAVRCR